MSAGMIPFGTAWYNNGAVGVLTVEAGPGISVDATDPQHPIVTNTGVITIVAGDNITVDDTDPQNPIVASTASGGNFVIVDLIDTNASPINFAVDETDPDIVGYQIRGRIRSGDEATRIGLRFNGDTAANYDWIITKNDGVGVSVDSGSGASSIELHDDIIDDDVEADFVIDIPVSALNVGAISRRVIWSLTTQQGEGSLVQITGIGSWNNVADITQISLVALAGAFETNCRVALYKTTGAA